MASELRPPNGDQRPAAPSRARTAVEKLLPVGIVRRRSSRPPATPHMERSVSSMAESFVDYWGQCSRNPPDVEGAKTPELVAGKEDGLTPISNWAHLNYMKTQRNTLRVELKAHQAAGAEAKRSVASLRRLAFRMAVNISVKERQIASSARSLAQGRKSNYLEGRDVEKRVEGLKRALRIEEGRNKEILEALERASMLTLQYANPADRSRSAPSPPPSPTTRLSGLSMTTLNGPSTPPRSTSSSWNDADWELTPGLASPTEIRTSDSRLIRAKRESDHALSACRRRINELQAECARSKEVGHTLEASKIALGKDMAEHQARIATLEQARATVQETLESTRLQLEVSTGLEDGLKQKLRMKNKELTSLQQGTEDRQKEAEALQNEKSRLLEQLKERDSQLQRLGTRTATLEESLETLEAKLDTAKHEESSLRDQLMKKENANEELRKRLDRGSKYEQILQKKIAEHEQEILGNVKKIEVGGGLISSLREQMKHAESNKKNIEQALKTLRAELSNLETSRGMEAEERSRLTAELSVVQTTKTKFEEDLIAARHGLEQQRTDKSQLQSELKVLRSSQDDLHDELQSAESRIQALDRMDNDSQTKLELLHDEKASIEADLKDARQMLFTLRERERMNKSELAELRSSEKNLLQELHVSQERVSALETDLERVREAQVEADKHREEESRNHSEQVRELQVSVASLQATLEASESLKASLQKELAHFQSSKSDIEAQLENTLRSKADLQTELDTVRSSLDHTTSASGHLKTKVAALEADLSTSRDSHSYIEARLTSLHDERDSLKTLVSELELTLNDSREAKSKVEEGLRVAQLDGEASGAEVAELHDQLNKAQYFKQEADSARLDLESQLQTAQTRLAEVETAERQTRSELSALRAELAETSSSKAEIEERVRMSQTTQDELREQLQSTESRLRVIDSAVDALKSDLVESGDRLDQSHRAKAEVEMKLKETLETHAELEKELETTCQRRNTLESDLASVRMRLTDIEADNVRATSKLVDRDEVISNIQQNKSGVEVKLSEALATTVSLEKELESTKCNLECLESQHASLTTKMLSADQELASFREQKAQNEQSEDQTSTNRKLLSSLESEKVNLTTDVNKAHHEMTQLREANAELEESVHNASERATAFESELNAIRVRLEAAETDTTTMKSKLTEGDKARGTLLQTNSRLTDSEKDLSNRLASAEEELQTVQDTNKRLEAFLERVEQDMAHAETAFEESEKRLEEFVEESQAKLDAARNAKLKYKRRLSERTNEIEILLNENAELHNQVGKQTQELGTLARGKEKLEKQLSEKENFANEVKSSSDKRMRSMNSAYNELRSKYEEQLREQQEESANRLEHELQKKNSMIDGLRQDKGESNMSPTALEQEVHALREDKKAFERLVATLREKIRRLEILEEWQEPVDEEKEVITPSKAGPSKARPDSTASTSPSTQHTHSSRSGSILSRPTSIGHPGAENERPTTRASTASRQEDLDAWAKEIERIRMLRNEQAIELRENKKARGDLRKCLKDSKLQLHQLEKQSKPARHRQLLRKNRPSTALRTSTADPDQTTSAPTTPSRPATAAGMSSFSPDTARSRHTIHFSPDTVISPDRPERPTTSTPLSTTRPERPNTSTPLSANRRWSTLHRPKSFHRPATSAGLHDDAPNERPTTSAGERVSHEHKERKRWSLRGMFK